MLGIITIADKHGSDTRFSDEDMRVAEALAQRAAEAIDQSRRVSRHTVAAMLEAQEAERGHLSRELHDQTGQALTAILLGLGALKRPTRPPAARSSTSRRSSPTRLARYAASQSSYAHPHSTTSD